VQKSSIGPPTQKQQQHPKSSSSEARGAFRLQNATSAVSGHPATLQITHERNPGPNGRPLELAGVNSKPKRVPEDDVGEGSSEYHAEFAAPHSSPEGEVARSELERQLSVSLSDKTERERRIAQLADEPALKSTLLEQAEASASNRAGLKLVDMQARLDKLEKLLLSHDQQIGQYKKELANVHAKLEAKESELEAVRLRLTDVEKGWIKSKAEADTIRAQTATGSVNKDEDQVTRSLIERVQAIEAEMASRPRGWNEKRIEEMECRNEKSIEEMECLNEG
jgi:hypothetical protein